MDAEQLNAKVRALKSDIESLIREDAMEPCSVACLSSALAHIDLLYYELGLDVSED